MKISMFSTDYLPNIGGVAQHIFEISKALQDLGHNVELLAPETNTSWSNLRRRPFKKIVAGVPVYWIPWTCNRTIKFFSGRISASLSRRKFHRASVERFNTYPPDVLHWHALDLASFPVEEFQGPKIWTNHTSNFIEGIKTPSGLQHYQREASSADEIICPSEELADLTIRIGIPKDRVHFISNGVDSKRFRPDVDASAWRAKLGLSTDERLILCPRRLEKKNGVRFFIEAAIEILSSGAKNCVFAVAGNYIGPKSDSDEFIVADLIDTSGFSANFRLLGRVENTEIPGLYSAAHFVVMPSLLEATSLSAMEAMSSGKAVLSTNVGGLPFLIRDGENGLLVPPANSREIANGMRKLLADPELCKRLGDSGRRRVEKDLDWSRIAEQTLSIYEKAINKHRHSAHA
jgi:glycosyltransferase involved in cell wall biosynthesis